MVREIDGKGAARDGTDDREHWNRKYRAAPQAPTRCDPWFLELLPNPPSGAARAADLACGNGRHALELARRGWRTCAVDVSDVALRRLHTRAREQALPLAVAAADLRAPPPFTAAFDLIVVVSYLERELLPRLQDLACAGGRLLYVTFTSDWPGDKPGARFRLAPGELARGLPGFRTLTTRESGGRAALLAQRHAAVEATSDLGGAACS